MPIWVAQTLGAFNDNLLRWSLVVLAAYQGLSVLGIPRDEMAPIAAAVFTVPIFLFSAIAGQFIDRFDRMKVMQILKLAELILIPIAVLGFLFQQVWVLLFALFAMGVQSTFFIPARQSAMPTLLKPEELVTGNGLVSGAVNIAILIGAMSAALLVGQDFGLWVICALLSISAILGWVSIHFGIKAPSAGAVTSINWNIFTAMYSMLKAVFAMPSVARPLLGVAWFWMIAAAFITLLPTFVRDVLGSDSSAVAILQLLFTIGSALGALCCAILATGRDVRWFIFIGAAGIAISSIDLTLYSLPMRAVETMPLLTLEDFISHPPHWRIMASLFLAAFFGGLFLVPQQAMAQQRSNLEQRGRLLAGGSTINGFSATLGPLSLILFARLNLPLQSAFIGFGSLTGLIALGVLYTLLKENSNSPS